MTADMIHRYSLLVEFLGRMLGPDYEIVLHDISRKQPSVIAIANGQISGRTIGAPLTNVAMQIIAERAYETQDWKLNYRGVSAKGRILRCSTLFIKDERGALVGLLCINFDDSHFRELSERVFALCHPDDYAARNISISTMPCCAGTKDPADSGDSSEQEIFYNSIASATEAALSSLMNSSELPADRLTKEERLKIIQLLDQKGTFTLKGAVPVVAQKLSCSQASIYRYLSKIHQEQNPDK